MRSPARLAAATVLAAVAALLWVPAHAQPADRPVHRTEPQTSDGVPGTVAVPLLPHARRAAPVVTHHTIEQLATGVTYERWDEVQAPRAQVRVHLLRVDLGAPGVRLDYAAGESVRDRQRVARLVRDSDATAGVNGDFFDIIDTGAPLGNAVDREDGIRSGRRTTWTSSFWIGADETPHIGQRRLLASIEQHPRWRIAHLNSPTVWAGQIGVYTPAWGTLVGTRVVDRQRRGVRQVVIRHGRVRSNSTTLTSGQPVRGLVLIGRGRGAERLRQLRVGSRADVTWRFAGDPVAMISGSEVVLQDGKVLARDDVEQHPRTAVGIDDDTGQVLLLVVDGRQDFSRGYTLREVGRALRRLGAESGLNLDGGGSSTLVGPALDPDGGLQVLNSPSDGHPRKVANGLVVYADPA